MRELVSERDDAGCLGDLINKRGRMMPERLAQGLADDLQLALDRRPKQ